MGSLRVGHDWATSLSLFTFMHWRRKWQPTPVFLPGESRGQGSLVGCSVWGHTESDKTWLKRLSSSRGSKISFVKKLVFVCFVFCVPILRDGTYEGYEQGLYTYGCWLRWSLFSPSWQPALAATTQCYFRSWVGQSSYCCVSFSFFFLLIWLLFIS